MADEKKSIFKFADKFGIESPLKYDALTFTTSQNKVSIVDLQIVKDQNETNRLISEDKLIKNVTGKEPTIIRTAIIVTVLTNGYCNRAKISIKNGASKECYVRPRSNGIYEAIAKFVLSVPKSLATNNGSNSVEFTVHSEIIKDGRVIDTREGKVTADTYRNIESNSVIGGKEYATDIVWEEAAKQLNIKETDLLKAIAYQESYIEPFLGGHVKILYERHIFYTLYKQKNGESKADELSKEHPNIVNKLSGGYGNEAFYDKKNREI